MGEESQADGVAIRWHDGLEAARSEAEGRLVLAYLWAPG